MKYLGTIAYRSGLGGKVDEIFAASLVSSWSFLVREFMRDGAKMSMDDFPNFHFMRGLSCDLEDAANQIADGFLGEWAIFLDTDHAFSSDALYEMITTFEDNNLDILTGFTQKRQPPYTPCIFQTEFDPMKNFTPIIPKSIQRHTLIQVDSGGLACLMVRRKVFSAIEKYGERPFDKRDKFNAFHMVTRETINRVDSEKLALPRRITERFWEDVSFYWRAQMMGYKVFCAPWIKFHHIETRLVDETLIQDVSYLPNHTSKVIHLELEKS